MAQSLAVKYRPVDFESILDQSATIKILQRQLDLRKFTNCYLFCGSSGTGKTTSARAFANQINQGKGSPIEIDAASNSGVDSVREIISSANERSIDSEYKIFIIDECHAITSTGWQAFLKCIEEPPKYTIFMFCTTNPEKVPETISNRCMRLNISKVSTDLINDRLQYICKKEGFTNYVEACDYISKMSNGGVRDAISLLEKCANFDTDLDIENVLKCLGNFSYDSFFNLTGALLNGDEAYVIEAIENYYNSGNDLKLFVEQYLDFTLDLVKYCLFKTMNMVKIPRNLQARCEAYSNIPDILNYSNELTNKILNIKNTIRYDVNSKDTILVMMINICRGI